MKGVIKIGRAVVFCEVLETEGRNSDLLRNEEGFDFQIRRDRSGGFFGGRTCKQQLPMSFVVAAIAVEIGEDTMACRLL